MLVALDCSLNGFSLAVVDPARGPLAVVRESHTRSTEAMHAALEQIFLKHDLKPEDVTTIVLTVGPGSFTGSRLGLALAAALKMTLPSLRIVGLSTLQVLARQVVEHHQPSSPFMIVTDAAGGSVYVQSFAADGKADHPAACKPLAEALAEKPHTTLLVTTTDLLLPIAPDITLAEVDPLILAAMVTDDHLHLPAEPLYVKPLTYKKAE